MPGEHDERRPQRGSFEDPGRDHRHRRVALVWLEHGVMDFFETRSRVDSYVVDNRAFGAAIEIRDAGPALTAQRGPARGEEVDPMVAVDSVILAPRDVDLEPVARRPFQEASP